MNRFGVLNLVIAIGLVATVADAIDCNKRPDMKSLKDCCPYDGIISKEITEKCKSLLPEGTSGPGGIHEPGGACYAQCKLNATGIVNLATMTVDEAKAKTYLTAALSANPDFVQVTSDALVKCAEKGREMRAMFEKNPHPTLPPGACKPCAAMLMMCVKKETMINCPTSAWKNDETCNNAREFMMVCKPPPGGPHAGRPE